MKNYWLLKVEKEQSNKFNEELLHELSLKYVSQPNKRGGFVDDLADLLYQLSDLIIDYTAPKCLARMDRDDVVQELVFAAWLKLPRFDPNQGKAFNFFTTIMLGHLRQL